MMLALVAIVMFFAAFTSAYVIRKGLSEDWQATGIPGILWWNTLVLLASSVTLEKARRSWSRFERFANWWLVTTLLGAFFLVGQLVAWRQLAARGVYMDTNPSSSFFYLLTGAHGLHLLGGVLALLYIFFRIGRRQSASNGQVTVSVAAVYWHFMDGLWVYLFLLLLLWR
jgi:cytochrome c oxidase subunit 3